MTLRWMLRRPSAFLPLVMSLAALAMVVAHVAFFGVVRQADEGTAAHLFQLLMATEAPIIAFFAITWLPRDSVPALRVLALQIAAALAPLALVFVLEL